MQGNSQQTIADNTTAPPVNAASSYPNVTQAREPLPSIQTFTQSKTFIASSGVNPLVAAASALFSLNSKLANCELYEDIDALRENLVHEVKAFECAAHTHNYSGDSIMLARYAICASLDEAIQNSEWGKAALWQENNLLTFFQGENWNDGSFFLILDKLYKTPEVHLDLLEFMYICLSLGFCGNYRGLPDQQEQLDRITDKLYHMIQRQRGDFPHLLSSQKKFVPQKNKQQKHTIPLWKIGLVTSIALGTLFLGFNYMVHLSTTPIHNKLSSLANTVE